MIFYNQVLNTNNSYGSVFLKLSFKNNISINNFSKKGSRYTIESFLSALRYNRECAYSYISKNYINKIDISIIPNGVNTPILMGVNFKNSPKDCKIHTVLTFSDEGSSLIHFYTMKEKDMVSDWKIYYFEKEFV
ncbi:MAG: hypothetical protein FWF57_00360 [Defluviitaleaceae bacterium]|nr:hypothetical protein [Defluviitaleaceae bacterium]